MRFHNSVLILTFFGITALASFVWAAGANPQGTVGYTGVNIGETIERLEQTTDAFTGRLDGSLDKSILDDTSLADRLKEWAGDLDDAVDKVKSEFSDHDAVRSDVAKTMRIGGKINDQMLRRELGDAIEADWANIRADLNTLARAYGQAALLER